MSVKQMALVWEHEFPHNKQSVMLALTDHANDRGERIFPSVARIAWKTGYSKRQASRIIEALTEDGVLVKVRFSTQHRPNEYRVNWKKAKKKTSFETKARGDKLSTLKNPESTSDQSRVDISNSRVDIAESTKPSFEPSNNEPLISYLKDMNIIPEPGIILSWEDFLHISGASGNSKYKVHQIARKIVPIRIENNKLKIIIETQTDLDWLNSRFFNPASLNMIRAVFNNSKLEINPVLVTAL